MIRTKIRAKGWLRLSVCIGAGASAPPVAFAEWYVSGYLGAARTHAADVVVEQPEGRTALTFERVPFRGRSFESPVYYGLRAGNFFRRRLGIEAEFVHLKVYAGLDRPVQITGQLRGLPVSEVAPLREYATQFEVSHGLNLLLANLVFRQPLAGGPDPERAWLLLLLRAGAGPTIPRPEVILFDVASGEYQFGPVAGQAAAGVALRVWRGVHVFGEYKYTHTATRFDIACGVARFRAQSHHTVSGISLYF